MLQEHPCLYQRKCLFLNTHLPLEHSAIPLSGGWLLLPEMASGTVKFSHAQLPSSLDSLPYPCLCWVGGRWTGYNSVCFPSWTFWKLLELKISILVKSMIRYGILSAVLICGCGCRRELSPYNIVSYQCYHARLRPYSDITRIVKSSCPPKSTGCPRWTAS